METPQQVDARLLVPLRTMGTPTTRIGSVFPPVHQAMGMFTTPQSEYVWLIAPQTHGLTPLQPLAFLLKLSADPQNTQTTVLGLVSMQLIVHSATSRTIIQERVSLSALMESTDNPIQEFANLVALHLILAIE